MAKIVAGFYEVGGKKFPMFKHEGLKPRKIIHSEHLWRERSWEARREADGRCFFEFQLARHGGGIAIYEITEQEFSAIKTGELVYEDLLNLTDRNSKRDVLSRP